MYRLIESIKLQNKQLQQVEWHNRRFNEVRKQLFGINEPLDLREVIEIPDFLDDQLVYKCRLLYSEKVETVEFHPYVPREVRTLQLVDGDGVEYTYKYEDRRVFERLLSQKGEADDILIVKDGCITDTSYSNIVFFDGESWWTPDTFLLNGTKRQYLLAVGLIRETRINPLDLKKFIAARPINAMLDLEETPDARILCNNFPQGF